MKKIKFTILISLFMTQLIFGVLTVDFLSRFPNQISRAPLNGVVYKCRMYQGATLYDTGDSYYANVYDANTNNINLYFNISPLSFNSSTSNWEIEIKPLYNTPVVSNFFIGLGKNAGGDGETLSEEYSIVDLSSSGMFNVTFATLSISYVQRSPDFAEQACEPAKRIEYQYQIMYPDGNSFESQDADNYSIKIIDPIGQDITTNFNISTPTFFATKWYLYVQPKKTAKATNGYKLSIAKSTNDVLLEKSSSIPTNQGGLGPVDGIFAVSSASLSVTFTSASNINIVRGSLEGATYFYNIYYPDGTTEETEDTGYNIKIYNSSANDVSSNFIINGPNYNAGAWSLSVNALTSASAESNYYIGIEKSIGSTGTTMTQELSTEDLGIAGNFNVTISTLSVTFLDISTNEIRKADANLIYKYQIFYPDGITQETNDTGYIVHVLDSGNFDVSSNFIIGTPSYSQTNWEISIAAKNSATVGAGYKVEISKISGTEGNVMPATLSAGFTFSVAGAQLNVTYNSLSTNQILLADGVGTTLSYNIFYPDSTEETNDSGYIFNIYNNSGIDRTTNFTISSPMYVFGHWEVTIIAGIFVPVENGYIIGISKTAGAEGDTLTEEMSTNDLGQANGAFQVTNSQLSLTYLNRDTNSIEQADGTGVVYSYQIYYPDGITEETVDTNNYAVKIYNTANSDVSFDFSIATPQYTGGHWECRIIALQNTPIAADYKIGISKNNNDILIEEYSTNGDLGANGTFSVTDSTLSIQYVSRTPASTVRGSTNGITYFYNIFYGDNTTKLTNDAGSFLTKVYNNMNSDVSTNFTIGTPTYISNKWQVTIKAKLSATNGNGYKIGMSKVAGSSGEIMAEEKSDVDLAATGLFNISNALLSITYVSRNNAVIERADGIGTTYFYNIFFSDLTEETNDTGYIVKIYDKNTNDISGQFNIGTPSYTNGAWKVNLTSLDTTPVDNGYMIGISKTGGNGDLSEELSIKDLGSMGSFAVTNTTLSITYLTITTNTISKADGTGTSFHYQIFYKDGITEENNDTGYTVNIFNKNNIDVTPNFVLTGPTYTGSFWDINVQSKLVADIDTGYYLQISKSAGTEGDIMNIEASTNDLSNGKFSITNAILSITYANRSPSQMQRLDISGINYNFNVYYPNGTTEEKNQTNYAIKIYNSILADVTTDFSISKPTYSAGAWHINIKGLATTAADTNFCIGIFKTNSQEDLLSEELSTVDLGSVNGCFDVSDLTVSFLSNTTSSFERADGTGTTFKYKLFYNAGPSELTNGSGYAIHVYDSTTNDVSGNFVIGLPNYSNGFWNINIQALDSTPAQTGYFISLEKQKGSDGSILLEENSLTDLGASGSFTVTNAILSISNLVRSPSAFEKVDGLGVLYTYKIFYPDGLTEEKNDSGYNIFVYNNLGTDVSAQFIITSLTYSAGLWRARVQALPNTITGSNFFIGLSKTAGGEGDTMPLILSTNLIGTNAYFDVYNASLSITYLNRNISLFPRADGNGTTFYYRLFFNDGTTQKVDGDAYVVHVYDSDNIDRSSYFTIGVPSYAAGQWSVNIQALSNASVISPYTNYRIGISKSVGTDGDSLTEEMSTNDLGNVNGTFDVANLYAVFSNESVSQFERSDGIGVNFFYHIYYPNGSEETTQTNDYILHVYNNFGTDVTGSFNLSSPVYTNSIWKINIMAKDTTAIANNYYFSIKKTNLNNSAILVEEASTIDLGVNGEFDVLPATLNITYSNRTTALFERADGTGTTFQYKIFYDDGLTQETNDTGYIVRVLSTNNSDVSANFNIGAPIYSSGFWSVNIQSYDTTPVLKGYRLSVSKNVGTKGDTMLAEFSTNDLGYINGTFGVTNAALNISFNDRNPAFIEQGDNTGVQYRFRAYYGDGTTQEINDIGYILRVYNNSGVYVSTNFTIVTNGYTAGFWVFTLYAKYDTPVDSGYYISMEKTDGSEGDFAPEEPSTNDLSGAGIFSITEASLNITYLSRSSGSIARSDGTGVTYAYRVHYDNNVDLTNDTSSFTVKVLTSANVDVSGSFNIDTPIYNGTNWIVNVRATNTTPVANNYKISVEKTSGISGDTLAAERSDIDLGGAGRFNVTYANLSITYNTRSVSVFERADGNGTTYDFHIYYPDNSELTNGSLNVFVYNSILANVSTDFFITSSSYSNSKWNVNIQAKDTANIGTNFSIGVQKTTGDTLAIERSMVDLGTAGYFQVTNANLSITYLSNSTDNIHQSDGIGVNYYYQIFYGDNLTQETNDTGYNITVYSNDINMNSHFKISNLGYNNHWTVNIKSYYDTPLYNNYYIGISKSQGGEGDVLAEKMSTNDLSPGTFAVTNEPTLHITYLSRSTPVFRRTDGSGTTYTYQVFYGDNITQETQDIGYLINVYNNFSNNVTSEFTNTQPIYTNGAWKVRLLGKTNTTVSTNFFIGIAKTPGNYGDTMNEEYSTIDLGSTGMFDTTDLRIEYVSLSNTIIEQADDVAATYYFHLYLNESMTEITNASGFLVNVFDASTNNINSYFTISTPVYTNSMWNVKLYSHVNSPVNNNNFISIGKDYTDGHALISEDSRIDLGGNGLFDIIDATLSIKYNNQDVISFEKLDGVGVNYQYKILYDNGTEETNDVGYVIKVYDLFNADRSTRFIITNEGYQTNGYWKVNIQAQANASAQVGYKIGISKTAGGTGDTLSEERSTDGDLGAAGSFEVLNATLNIVYLSRGTPSFERADGIGTYYDFDLFYDDMTTEEISDEALYNIHIFSSNQEYTTNFQYTVHYISSLGHWRATNRALDNALPFSNYYIVIQKTNGGSTGATLGDAPETPEKSTLDLGATNGSFAVRYATLNFVYHDRNNLTIERGGTNGTTYRYKVYYDDMFTIENNDIGYIFNVYDSGNNDVSSNFISTNLSFAYPYWSITIKAKPQANTGNNYYISISKSTGNEGDTALEENSINGDITPIANARFNITPATLTGIFSNQNTNIIYRASGHSVKYTFKVFFDNNEEKTNDTGYGIHIYNNTGGDVTSEFNILTPIYTNGIWQGEIFSRGDTTSGSNFSVGIYKTPGSSGDTMPEKNSTNDLGFVNGVFSVFPEPTLNLKFLSESTNTIEQADNGVLYKYQAFYDDGITQQTNDIGYIINVYDASTNLVASSTNASGNLFSISSPIYIGTNWEVRIKSFPSTPTNSGYFIGVSKSQGGWGDTMLIKYSPENLSNDGKFRVVDATLNLIYNQRLTPIIEQLDDNSVIYKYNVYYDDMITEETNEIANYSVTVYNDSNVDSTSEFILTSPVYTNSNWQLIIDSKENTTVASNYYITISKSGGLSRDTLAEKASTNDLGIINGVFAVSEASLNITYKNRTPINIGKGNNSEVIYTYNIYYDNGTEETNDTGYQFDIFDYTGTNRNSWFNIMSYSYVTTNWEVHIEANNQTVSMSNYYIGISKTPGTEGDTLSMEVSLTDLGAPAGSFNVTSMTLSIVFSNRTIDKFERGDLSGTTYSFKILYPDGVTEETNDTGYITKVYNKNNINVSSNFSLPSLSYSNGLWYQSVIAHPNVMPDTGYYITVEKLPGTKKDILLQKASTNDLGIILGVFQVTNATLNLVYQSRDNPAVGRADGVGVNYFYKVYYDDMFSEETNDTGYNISVYDKNNQMVSTQFMISSPTYTNGQWKVNLIAKDSPAIDTNYYIGIEKTAGTKGDILAIETSITDLMPNGHFAVQTGYVLSISYFDRDIPVIEQGSDIGTKYRYKIFYPDMITEETNDTGYFIKIYDASTNEITCSTNSMQSKFAFNGPSYFSNYWHITITAKTDSIAAQNYFIGIGKTKGVSLDTLTEESALIDIGTNGYFDVENATLNVVFSNRTPVVTEQSGTGITYRFRVFYDDGMTQLTGDTNSFNFVVYNSNGINVSTNFIIYNFDYISGAWEANIRPKIQAYAGNGYYLGVSKNNGNTGDSFNLTNSRSALGTAGVFAITNASLNLTFLNFNTNYIYKAHPDSVLTNRFQVFYDDGMTQETNDTGYNLRVIDSSNVDRTSWFSNTTPVYKNNSWQILIRAKSIVLTNNIFKLGITKIAGSTGFTLAEKISTNDLSVSGLFSVIGETLSATFVTNSHPILTRADGIGTLYKYKIYYSDLTEETNDIGYTIKVYDSFSNNVTTNFIISPPVYISNFWHTRVQVSPAASVQSNYFISVTKSPGNEGDILPESSSGSNIFHIVPANLNLVSLSFDNNSVQPTESFAYRFQIFYPNNTTQLKTGVDSSWFAVYNNHGTNTTSQVIINNIHYEITNWAADVFVQPFASISSSNYLAVSGTNSSDILSEEMSFVDLASNGRFDITSADLTLHFISLSKRSIRPDESFIVKFKIFYTDNSTELTNGLSESIFDILNRDDKTIKSYYQIKNLQYTQGTWQFSLVANSDAPAGHENYIKASGTINGNNLMVTTTLSQLGNISGTFVLVRENTIYQNFPNPFNPENNQTTFFIDLDNPSDAVEIRIYTLTGNLVRILNEGDEIDNKYEVQWDGHNDHNKIVSSGIYYAYVKAGSKKAIIKVMVVRW